MERFSAGLIFIVFLVVVLVVWKYAKPRIIAESDFIPVPKGQIEKLSLQVSDAQKLLDIYRRSDKVRYLQVEFINEGDQDKEFEGGEKDYQQFISELMDDPKFQWFLYKRQMEFVDVMNQIPNSDPKSAEMRIRAAHRMDGVCRLIDTMAAIKRAYLISTQPKEEEAGIG